MMAYSSFDNSERSSVIYTYIYIYRILPSVQIQSSCITHLREKTPPEYHHLSCDLLYRYNVDEMCRLLSMLGNVSV